MDEVKGFKVGSFASFKHKVTLEDIKKFAQITGDDNPIHLDRDFARQTPFKDIIAHGMLSASYVSTIIGKHLPGDGALWLSQSFDFLLPVRVNDTLDIRATVSQVNKGQQTLDLKIEIMNQNDQLVLKGTSKVKAIEYEKQEQTTEAFVKPVTLITGGSRGIGAATARLLAALGHNLVINYRQDEEAAIQLARSLSEKGIEVLTVRADVSRKEDLKDLLEKTENRFGYLTGLVSNATSKMLLSDFSQLKMDNLRQAFEINFFAAAELFSLSLPLLTKQACSSVVTLGTIAVDNVPPQQMLAYTTSKSALINLTKCLAQEFGPKGVRFNVVSPGMTDTLLVADLPQRAKMTTKMQTPLRRLAEPEDIANGIAFLLGPQSKHITGETLRICGGAVML